MAEQTQVLTSAKTVQDVAEGVLLLQHRKEWLRCLGADRAHVEDLRNRGHLSEEDYARVEASGWLPPVLSTGAYDATLGIERLLARKDEEGRDQRRAQRAAEDQARLESATSWVQTSLFAAGGGRRTTGTGRRRGRRRAAGRRRCR